MSIVHICLSAVSNYVNLRADNLKIYVCYRLLDGRRTLLRKPNPRVLEWPFVFL